MVLSAGCSPAAPTASADVGNPASIGPTGASTGPSTGPSDGPSPSPLACTRQLRVGLVAQPGSLADNGYNQSAAAGLAAAAAAVPSCFRTDAVASKTLADAAADLKAYADDGDDVVIGVGQSLGDTLGDVAATHPNVRFIGVDAAPGPTHDQTWQANGESLFFAEDQQGYLAGALAALVSHNRNVGVVGGLLLVPQVESSVEGFLHGAAATLPGITIQYAYTTSFSDPAQGGGAATAMIAKGADVIFSTGSATGDGALLAACKAGVMAIGSDTDQALSLPAAAPCLISSAMKNVAGAVTGALLRLAGGSFTPGFHTDDAASGGIVLAPGHDLAGDISAIDQDHLDTTLRGLADGSIQPDVVIDGKTP
jgi:basic membrane protein A and related proteins